MFQTTTPHFQRQLKTSEPRFKRLHRFATPDNHKTDLNRSVHNNFPLVNRGVGLDNSKQNLCYETHLMKVRSACKLDETAIVSTYLNSIRKDFDSMSKNSRLQLANIRLKRKEIDLIKSKNKQFAKQREQFEQKILLRQRQASAIRSHYEDSKMQTKTLENIIERMKKDEIFYKRFGRIRDEEVKNKLKELKLLDQNIIHQDAKLQTLTNILHHSRGHYNNNQDLRQKKYEDFADKISDVQDRDKFIELRKERTCQLQSIELNDTLDQKNIHMRQIILAHKIADCLLESKVSTLIKKYADVQNAFHLIKLKTCVSEPQLLASKFFSYEHASESLLGSINQNERKIEELLTKKQKLTEQYQQIINQTLSISDSKNASKLDSSHFKMDEVVRGIHDKQLLKDQIQSWIDKRIAQFHLEGQNSNTFQSKFKHLCNYLCDNIKKYQRRDYESKKTDAAIPKVKTQHKQHSGETSSLLRLSDEPSQSNLIQQEYIRLARQNALKKGFSIKNFKRDANANR